MLDKYGFVYVTSNKINGKKYIGQKKIDNSSRWKSYLGSGSHLLKAIKKYGKANFERVVIDYADSEDELNELEKYYIEKFNAVASEDYYNLIEGGTVITQLNKINAIPVINIDTGYVFKSIKDASKWSGVSESIIIKSFDYKHSIPKKTKDLIFKKLEILVYGEKLCRCCSSIMLHNNTSYFCGECMVNVKFNSMEFKDIKLCKTNICFELDDQWVIDSTIKDFYEECIYKYYPLTKNLNSKNKNK